MSQGLITSVGLIALEFECGKGDQEAVGCKLDTLDKLQTISPVRGKKNYVYIKINCQCQEGACQYILIIKELIHFRHGECLNRL